MICLTAAAVWTKKGSRFYQAHFVTLEAIPESSDIFYLIFQTSSFVKPKYICALDWYLIQRWIQHTLNLPDTLKPKNFQFWKKNKQKNPGSYLICPATEFDSFVFELSYPGNTIAYWSHLLPKIWSVAEYQRYLRVCYESKDPCQIWGLWVRTHRLWRFSKGFSHVRTTGRNFSFKCW